jgi:tRNA-specific 2-thiouridylase
LVGPPGMGPAGLVRVVLDEPGVIALGQACVMYDGDRVLGGGFLRTRLSVDTDRAAAQLPQPDAA